MRHLTAPFEVGDDVVGLGLVVPPVLGLEPVPEVRPGRHGNERRTAPPSRTGEPTRLRNGSAPQPRAPGHGNGGGAPEPSTAARTPLFHGG
jgi:hypothetical protein